MTADLPDWAMEKALHLAYEIAVEPEAVLLVPLARALVSVATARDERAAGIARDWPLCELKSTSATDHKMTFETGARAQRNAIAAAILADGGPNDAS